MARPRKSTKDHLTPGQASYVLERLVKDRRVSKGEISRYMGEMESEIGFLEKRLQSLREAAGNVVAMLTPARRRGRPPATASAGKAPAKRRRRRGAAITAEQKASRQLQGRYLGLIRQIPASRRAQYQRIAKDKGREAAIKEMSSALGK